MKKFWGAVQEPRVITVLAWVAYLIVGLIGVSAMAHPPASIHWVLGSALTYVWATFLVLSGVIGALTTLQGVWWLERAAVLLAVGGAAIYATVVVTLQAQGAEGNRLPQSGFILVTIIFFATRWLRIHKYSYDPEPPIPPAHAVASPGNHADHADSARAYARAHEVAKHPRNS